MQRTRQNHYIIYRPNTICHKLEDSPHISYPHVAGSNFDIIFGLNFINVPMLIWKIHHTLSFLYSCIMNWWS